jgi:hypothetical protein
VVVAVLQNKALVEYLLHRRQEAAGQEMALLVLKQLQVRVEMVLMRLPTLVAVVVVLLQVLLLVALQQVAAAAAVL